MRIILIDMQSNNTLYRTDVNLPIFLQYRFKTYDDIFY